jgi:hypothetical protein
MVRCPACGNENPPEYPPEEYPFCIECGAQLGSFRPPQPPPDPYASPDPYRQQPGGPPPYGQPPRLDPYGQPDPYGQQQPYRPDPYAPPHGGQPYGGGQPYAGGQPHGGGQAPADPYPGSREDTPYLPSAAGAARLILESGPGKIEYPLDADVVTIGRSRSNDISLDDARVSRHHARVVRDQRGYSVEDLNSRNGTRVDDRAVREAVPLVDGAVLRIGDSAFTFVMTHARAPIPGPRQQPAPYGGPSPYGGPPAHAAVPEVFSTPWSPVQCPTCQGLKTMRPIIYGPAAQSPGAQVAAQRGEVALGEGPPRPEAANAECRACGTRVRIVTTGG